MAQALGGHDAVHVAAVLVEGRVRHVAVAHARRQLPARDDEDDVVAEPDDAERGEDRHDDEPLLVVRQLARDDRVEGDLETDEREDEDAMTEARATEERLPAFERRQPAEVEVEDRLEAQPAGEAHQRVPVDADLEQL